VTRGIVNFAQTPLDLFFVAEVTLLMAYTQVPPVSEERIKNASAQMGFEHKTLCCHTYQDYH
jgi:uncharacterized membrane protein (UPF0127 family)